jgi:hypothetical protein
MTLLCKWYYENHSRLVALMAAASPDLEKQGFLAVVFVIREYSVQQEGTFLKTESFLLLKSKLSLLSLLLVISPLCEWQIHGSN